MSIEDARSRVDSALQVLSQRLPAGSMQGHRVLDIGCGTGNGVIAALKLGARSAVGVDRDPEEFGRTFFAELAAEYAVDERAATLIATDVFSMQFFDCGFDVVFMYDAIEHVPAPERFVQLMGRCLRPGGLGLILTCPLYYSPVGHHLWHVFPEETAPWAHLYHDFDERLAAANIGPWHAQRFRELNKVTRGALRGYIEKAGLRLVADESIFSERFVALMGKFGHLIDRSKVPAEEDLMCDYTSLLFTKD